MAHARPGSDPGCPGGAGGTGPAAGTGAALVLATLRAAGDVPCSGSSLSEALGVSRTQVWKHVEGLRARGYAIAGAAGGGYRLEAVPDCLYPEEVAARLETRWLAQRFHWLEETDSTNRVASELAAAGAPHGTTVVAEGQTAGRGRLGRSFFSPSGTNLYTSIVLRPELTLAEAPTLILAAGLAVAEAVGEEIASTARVAIKWPNDVLVDGHKTAGILMELSAEATRVGHCILGIGVNLNVDRDSFPDEFRARATSLRSATGRNIVRAAFAARLYGRLEDVLDRHAQDGFDALRPRFDALFRMAGERIRVADVGGQTTEGVALGISGDGALRLRTRDGDEVRLLAGAVTILKDAEATVKGGGR
jgi:BirA family biotin operon repressor/biotin-[acetyl-CoA-carboxylase] ligase